MIFRCGPVGPWTCEVDSCHISNFSIPLGEITLRANQTILGPQGVPVSPSVVTTAARPTNQVSTATKVMTDQASISTIASSCSITSAPAQSNSESISGKLGAVGAGIGVPLAIALLAAVVMIRRERGRNQTLSKERQQLATEADEHRRNVEQLEHWTSTRNSARQNSAAFQVSEARYPAEIGTTSPTELGTHELRELGTWEPTELGSVHARY